MKFQKGDIVTYLNFDGHLAVITEMLSNKTFGTYDFHDECYYDRATYGFNEEDLELVTDIFRKEFT